MDNLTIYNALKQPPKEALRQIQGGRLAGKTDINPQWRYKAMTEQFGVCGVGWKFETVRLWSEPTADGQVFAFAQINLYTKQGDTWSDPIPGCGGSMLIEKEKAGLHANDEGYKMAITDALSTAMKMLGVAADIYAGLWDGAKYRDIATDIEQPSQKATESKAPATIPPISTELIKRIYDAVKAGGITTEQAKAYLKKRFNKSGTKELTLWEGQQLLAEIKSGKLGGDSALVKAAKELGAEKV